MEAEAKLKEEILDENTIKSEPVLLNLGCGTKLLPDPWINIDKESYGGIEPDIITDISNLEMFDKGSAHVVMAIHVIEHFYPWEIPAILEEWYRVLTPGGLIIIECPDILKAANFLLAGKGDNMAMWPFYGDPNHRNPLMMHKWGYTPETLGHTLTQAGFMRVEEKPAEYHMGPIRDMRLVAEKPL